jgi:site-specific DNA recombinase
MHAVVYARQSVTREGSESLDTQVQVCREAAGRFGLEVVAELVEPPSTSGYKNRGTSRTKFKELLNGFRDHRWEVVIAYKTDRLSRGGGPGWAPLLDAIEKAGLNVDKAVATPSGFVSEFEIGIRAAMDREESKKTSERVSDVAARNAALGLPYSSIRTYGYERGYKAILPEEAIVLREMAKRVIQGHSFFDVTYWANEAGHKTAAGGLWLPSTVKRVLTRKAYAGIREYKGAEYAGTWEPIFDPETWERLQLTIAARKERYKNSINISSKYLLTGLVVCGVCGAKMIGTGRYNNKLGERHFAYHCRKRGDYFPKGGCGSVSRGRAALDHFITEAVLFRLDTPELGKLLSEQGDGSQLGALLEQRQLQQARLNGLVDDYASGLLSRQELARAKQTAEAELQRLDGEIAALTAHSAVRLDVGQTLRDAWEAQTASWRRALLALVIKQIVIKPTKKATGFYKISETKFYRFNPESVEIEWIA